MLVRRSGPELQRYLQAIQKVSQKYGLKLNETKCVLIRMNAVSNIQYTSGGQVPVKDATEYLGVVLSAKVDVKKELANVYRKEFGNTPDARKDKQILCGVQ